ncbi:hypothetical protein NPIL_171051 [Nephila pilipes]|uniref:Uncharacterized protein n=1 Tax=Nephila pilipes TaxID=299642 RepID=A0A8X6TZU5_NEPPI|nr:hypothetical protein NPIL_171051 [Nephila pilipes]
MAHFLFEANTNYQRAAIIFRDGLRVQLFESGPAVQARVQLLLDSNLHPMLYAGHRQLGFFLVGPECYPSSSFTWGDDSAHHGDPDLWDQCFFTTSLIHKSTFRPSMQISIAEL